MDSHAVAGGVQRFSPGIRFCFVPMDQHDVCHVGLDEHVATGG